MWLCGRASVPHSHKSVSWAAGGVVSDSLVRNRRARVRLRCPKLVTQVRKIKLFSTLIISEGSFHPLMTHPTGASTRRSAVISEGSFRSLKTQRQHVRVSSAVISEGSFHPLKTTQSQPQSAIVGLSQPDSAKVGNGQPQAATVGQSRPESATVPHSRPQLAETCQSP